MKNRVAHASLLENVLSSLADLETSYSRLQQTSGFESLNARQKIQYHYGLEILRALIYELEQDVEQEQQLAS